MKNNLLLLVALTFMSILGKSQTVNIFVDDRVGGMPDLTQVTASYTNAGFATVNISSGLIDATVTKQNYDVLIINEYYDLVGGAYVPDFLDSGQRAIAETFITDGGHVVWVAENLYTDPFNGTPVDQNTNMITTVNNIYGTNLEYGPYFQNNGTGNSNFNRVHPSSGPAGLAPSETVLATGSYATLLNVNGDNAIYTTGSTSDALGNLYEPCTHTTYALYPSQPVATEGSVIISTEVRLPFVGEFIPDPVPGYTVYEDDRDLSIAQLHFNLLTGVDMTSINNWLHRPGNFNPVCSSLILPIELVHFSALANQHQVLLNWKTATETNNDYFEVERSADGMEWEAILFQNGAGNSSSAIFYEAIDVKPLLGPSYYRLKQVNYDGDFTYSHIESVYVGVEENQGLSIYPNPAQNQVTVTGLSLDDINSFKLFSIEGKLLTGSVQLITETETSVVLDITQLKPGLYIIQTSKGAEKLYKQ